MFTRRRFVQMSLIAGSALTFGGAVPGMRSAAAAATPPLRRSLGYMDLDDPDLVTLREFITLMKDPSRDGGTVNWTKFSDVHGSFAGGFHKCPHGNWYFLPWHRAYLQMYEAAARSLTGRPEFALPYWDWTADTQLPRAFAEASFNGQPNPLFVADRSMGPNESLPPSIVGQQEVMELVYQESNFEAFGSTRGTDVSGKAQNNLDESWVHVRGISGTLEATPHDNMHCIIGGPFMCSAASAQDPLFLMHHGNIDRVWAVWNSLGRLNTSNQLWTEMPFTDHFISPEGTNYTKRVSELPTVEALGYTYGLTPAAPIADAPGRSAVLSALFSGPDLLDQLGLDRNLATVNAMATPQKPLDVDLAPDEPAFRLAVDSASLQGTETQGGASNARSIALQIRPPQIYAAIRGLEVAEPGSTQLRVFVNCDYLSQSTPTSDPHYVQLSAFSGLERMPSTAARVAPH